MIDGEAVSRIIDGRTPPSRVLDLAAAYDGYHAKILLRWLANGGNAESIVTAMRHRIDDPVIQGLREKLRHDLFNGGPDAPPDGWPEGWDGRWSRYDSAIWVWAPDPTAWPVLDSVGRGPTGKKWHLLVMRPELTFGTKTFPEVPYPLCGNGGSSRADNTYIDEVRTCQQVTCKRCQKRVMKFVFGRLAQLTH